MSIGNSLDLERTLVALSSHVEADRDALLRRITSATKTSQLTDQLMCIERTVLLTHISQLCQERAALKALLRTGGTDIGMDMTSVDGNHHRHVVESIVVSELRSALKETRERLIAAESRQRDIAKDMSALTTENVRLQTVNAELTATVHRQSADIAEANRQLNYVQNDTAKYRRQTAAAAKDTAIAQSREKANLQAEITQLKQRLRETESKVVSLQQEFEHHQHMQQQQRTQTPSQDDQSDQQHIAIIDETANVTDMVYRTHPTASPPTEHTRIIIGTDATSSEEHEHNETEENGPIHFSVNVSSPRRMSQSQSRSRSPVNTVSPNSVSTRNTVSSPISAVSDRVPVTVRSATPTHDGTAADTDTHVSNVNETVNNVEAATIDTPVTSSSTSVPLSDDDSSVVFVTGLPSGTDETALRAIFRSCGEIKSVRLPADIDKGIFSGAVRIEFINADGAARALEWGEQGRNNRSSFKVGVSRTLNNSSSVSFVSSQQQQLPQTNGDVVILRSSA